MELTPTQQRIFDLLKDGEPHLMEEVRACLGEEGELANLKDKEWALRANRAVIAQVNLLRRVIYGDGLTVICINRLQSASYQMLKHVNYAGNLLD